MSILDGLGLEPESPESTPAPEAPETPEAPAVTEPEAPEPIEVPEGAKNPDAVANLIAAERKAARDANARRRELEAELARIKEEGQPLEQRLQVASQRAQEAELKALRLEVGVAKGLPIELASRLAGSDAESLTQDAESLLEILKTKSAAPSLPGLDGGVRRPPAAPANPEQAHNAWLGEVLRQRRTGA